MNTLEVKHLVKQYDRFRLDDISFELPRGYIMGYVGQNGSGKTTTLNLITNLQKADEGECMIEGIRFWDNPVAYREAIGYVGDEAYFVPDFTLKNIKSICRDFYPTFREDQFEEYVKKWKLPYKKKIKDFSRGMKVKLMFATVLSRETKILILDEATNGLDPVVREEILEILQEYIKDGQRSVLFSTHILSDLEQIADYVFFIHNGRKILCEAKDDLLENYVLVKGGLEDIEPGMKKYLIGFKNSGVGFEAIAKSNDTIYLGQNCLFERPTIDQIMVHFIREREG